MERQSNLVGEEVQQEKRVSGARTAWVMEQLCSVVEL